MDIWQTVSVIFRRWYITVPAFVGALGLAAIAYSSVPTQYISTSVLVLTTPTTGPTEQVDSAHPNGITNPLLNFEQGLSLSATILIQELSTPEAAEALGVTPGGSTWYDVNNGSTNPELLTTGPFIFIQGTSATARGAQEIVRKVSDRAVADLAERQRALDAPRSTFITVNELVPATTPDAPKGSKLRAAGVAGTLGVLASLAAAFAFESAMTARRYRRSQRTILAPPDATNQVILEPSLWR